MSRFDTSNIDLHSETLKHFRIETSIIALQQTTIKVVPGILK